MVLRKGTNGRGPSREDLSRSRKSRMILHAESGANIHQIAAWSGHEPLKEIERYTKRAEKRRLLSPGPSALKTGKFP